MEPNENYMGPWYLAFLFTGEISPKGEIKYQKIDYGVFLKVFNRQK
jgi:hypothetical protein